MPAASKFRPVAEARPISEGVKGRTIAVSRRACAASQFQATCIDLMQFSSLMRKSPVSQCEYISSRLRGMWCRCRWMPPGTAMCTPTPGPAPCTSAIVWALRQMGLPTPLCTCSLVMQVGLFSSLARQCIMHGIACMVDACIGALSCGLGRRGRILVVIFIQRDAAAILSLLLRST